MISNPHTPAERLRWALHYGHQWCPAFPNLLNLDEGRVSLMDGSEQDAKDLIASWQLMDGNVGELVKAIHGRALIPDGDVGPASKAVMDFQRCALPDYPPPPGATFHYEDPVLQAAVERMQRATGSGSWPVGCHGTAGIHEVKVSYDISGLSDAQKEWMPYFKEHNARAVGLMGLKIIEVPVGEFANVRFYERSFGGSTIGMAEFNNGTCGDSVFCTVTRRYAPNRKMFTILGMHEFGHTMKFQHSNRYIMNSSIMEVPEWWVQFDFAGQITYQDVRYSEGKRYFGGKPIDQPPPPPPPPPRGPLVPVAEFDIAVPGRYKLFRDSPAPVPVPTQPVPT